MSKKQKKLMIIDGNALVYRSFHALPPTMKNKAGQTTNAVYGFTSALIKALRELKPEYVVLTLDHKGPTFRHLEYKEYKAHRVKQPDELYEQIPLSRQVAEAFNIPVFCQSGVEADDLIGTITKKVDGKIEKIILTGDMDTLQLVDENTKVYAMSRGINDSIFYDEKAARQKYGLDIDQLIDYKALRGDPSDNIPGVRGIGEKIAVDLLREFKSLKNLYHYLESAEKTDKIKPRIANLLIKYKPEAFLSQKLATIKRDVEIDFDLEKALFGDFDKEKILALFSELEFNSLLNRLKDIFGEEASNSEDKFARNQKFKYKLVDSEEDFKNFLNILVKQKSFTFDVEATAKKPVEAELLGISFSWEKGKAFYVNLKNNNSVLSIPAEINLFNYNQPESSAAPKDFFPAHPWLAKLKPIFENPEIKKRGHNFKYDVILVNNYGIEVKGLDFDTRIASYLLNPDTRQHDLDSLALAEFGYDKINKNDLLGQGKNKITYSQVEKEKMALYSCEDADFTERLAGILAAKLKAQNLAKLFSEIEIPLVSVLAKMERAGILISRDYLAVMEKKLNKRLEELSNKIYQAAGIKFNIKSTKQLKEVLFTKLKISTDNISKTKTGLSTAAKELAKLQGEHKIIPLLEEYRELAKLLNTYIESLPELIYPRTGRIHSSFNQTIAATGRLSSRDPNLQNIPIKTELGREIRKAFIAKEGYQLVSLDYSQIELRLAAHLSQDPKMIEAFQGGIDIHSATASAIYEVELSKVTAQMRREAKAINFGILYGQGPHGLSQTAGIPYWRAQEFIEQYFKAFSHIKKYIEKTLEKARETGYVETLFGRRRYLPDLHSAMMQSRKAAERVAINTPLQGTAADLIKIAMINADKEVTKINQNQKEPIAKMLLQVHDELVFEVKNDQVENIAKKIKQIMEQAGEVELLVPIEVNVKSGDNWGELIDLKF